MMRAKRLRVSLSPTRGSRGKGAWCYHRSHPPRHNGLSILRSKKVDIARGRVQRIPPVSVSNGLAVLLYQRLCDVTARPASCRGLAFGHFLGRCRPCTSASRLLGRRNCCHACRCTTRFDETKMRSSRGCFRSSASEAAPIAPYFRLIESCGAPAYVTAISGFLRPNSRDAEVQGRQRPKKRARKRGRGSWPGAS